MNNKSYKFYLTVGGCVMSALMSHTSHRSPILSGYPDRQHTPDGAQSALSTFGTYFPPGADQLNNHLHSVEWAREMQVWIVGNQGK